jgi:RimJ/RimL family protein N-acetyltransferase
MEPRDKSRVSVRLVPIRTEDLPALERGLVPERLSGHALADGLPPPHVASRIRQYLALGKPAQWVGMHYVVDADGCCIGGCGFKDVPAQREVEVGYGLAESRRGLGYASAALALLIELAKASEELDALVAYISLDNAASMRVATRAGFVPCERVFHEGEWQMRYRLTLRSEGDARCGAPD